MVSAWIEAWNCWSQENRHKETEGRHSNQGSEEECVTDNLPHQIIKMDQNYFWLHKHGIKRVENLLLHTQKWVKLTYWFIGSHNGFICNICLGLVEEELTKETEGSMGKN